jgi:hypothetical protein
MSHLYNTLFLSSYGDSWSGEDSNWRGESVNDATGWSDSDNLPEEDDFDDWFELLAGPEYHLIKRDGLGPQKRDNMNLNNFQ